MRAMAAMRLRMMRALLGCSWAALACSDGSGGGGSDAERGLQGRQRLQEAGAVWEVSDDELGPCAEECGQQETTLTRFVMCMEGGEPVNEARCMDEKPAESLVCPATAACIVYSWQADEFGVCDASCGTPATELHRSVQCVGDDGSTGDVSSCTGEKPAESLHCEAAAPCTYAWRITEGACPVDCGTPASTVERKFMCEDSDGSAVVDSRCTDPRPPTEQSCPATPACVTYDWSAPDFDPCPTGCGLAASTLTREVICRGSDDSVGVDANCTLDSRPLSTMECPLTANCVWHYSEFEACPSDCGLEASTLERVVECTDPADTTAVVESARCNYEEKPATLLDCEATAVCITYMWMGVHFDECPSECGLRASRLTRHMTCLGSDGHAAAEEMCTDPRPPTEQSCPATPACVTYDWSAPDFDPCPTGCGLAASTLTREVICRGSDDSVGVDANCTLDSRPLSTMECPLTANCVWHYSEFEACPSDCGLEASTLERVVECTDPADTTAVVESARCNYEEKPAEGHVCEATARCVVYEWDMPDFADCDPSCGLPINTIHRTVACRGDDGSIASTASSCELPMPAEAQTCPPTPNCTAVEMLDYLNNNPDCQVGELVFSFDIETFITGSSGSMEFEGSFKAELARFLGIAAARVQVLQTKAGSMIVVFVIKEPSPAQGGSDSSAAVSCAEAMHKLSRAMSGFYGEGSPLLHDDAEFPILSKLQLDAGLRTDVRCELAILPNDAGDEHLDCDHTDEWSALTDEFEDFAAAPTRYIGDPSHLNFVMLVGVMALAVLAMAFCLCRRCCRQSEQQTHEPPPLPPENGSYSRLQGEPHPDPEVSISTTSGRLYQERVPGGDASALESSTPTNTEETSSDFDEVYDDDVAERNAMLITPHMQGEGSYPEAVFRGSS